MTSASAISSLVWPSATSLTISSSRGVSGSRRRRLAAGGAVEVVADERRDGGGVEEGLAAHGRAAGLDEVAIGGALEHVARRPRLQRLEEVLLAVVHREHQRAQLGAPALELGRRLQPRHAGASRRRGWPGRPRARAPCHRLAPVGGLADDREVGLGVEHHAQAAQDDRVVVGEQDPRRQRCGHGGPSGSGTSRRTSVPPVGSDEIVRRAPMCSARSCMPAMPAPAGSRSGGQAAAVVAHDQAQAAVDVAQGDEHLRGAGVAHHVGQALLGDAVDHELDLRAHGARRARARARRAGSRGPPPRCTASAGRSAGRGRRAPRGAARGRCGARRRGCGARPRGPRRAGRRRPRRPRGRVLELEHDAGEDLADLVVQLARDPLALGLLGEQRLTPALAPLALEPVEHVVEGRRQRGDVGVGAADGQPAAGLERLDGAHRRGQPAQRRDDLAQQQHVEDHRARRSRRRGSPPGCRSRDS